MAGFKSQAKRKRELAKLDKRRAKDEKRALRRAERSTSVAEVAAPPVAQVAAALASSRGSPALAAGPARKPLTLAEAVERWKATKVVKAKPRR